MPLLLTDMNSYVAGNMELWKHTGIGIWNLTDEIQKQLCFKASNCFFNVCFTFHVCVLFRLLHSWHSIIPCPDMTFAVDWALSNNYLSIYHPLRLSFLASKIQTPAILIVFLYHQTDTDRQQLQCCALEKVQCNMLAKA